MTTKTYLFIALAGFAAFYLATWITAARAKSSTEPKAPTPLGMAIGFVTNFFDTLGIGSFATTTSLFRFWKMVRDEVIPGTLNVGHTLPTITQAFIYIAIINVDMKTLILLIAASVLGMWLGAGVVASWPRRYVQVGMGFALLVAAGLTLLTQYDVEAGAGTSLRLTGTRLAIGIAGNFALGALMSLGIGLYGPCLIMISLLGMDPKAAFPIMMGSCAFLMPVGSAKFVRKGSYNLRVALGLAIGGIPAVLIAAKIVKELPLYWVRWLVIFVVVYTALTLLRTAAREAKWRARLSIEAGSLLGALIAGAIGFLIRPYGAGGSQLPFSVVVKRGADLAASDVILRPLAETSFNFMLAGVIAGFVLGGAFVVLLRRLEESAGGSSGSSKEGE